MRICLISPGHLGSNPRLVKEADTLHHAGHQVTIIYGDTFPPARERDQAILKNAPWSAKAVSLHASGIKGLWRKIAYRFARILFRLGLRAPRIAAQASHPLYAALRQRALQQNADLYLGHNLPALPIVVEAARQHNARAGFDAEDFHSGESPDTPAGKRANLLASILEKTHLPKLHHATAASPLIAQTYEERYGIAMETLLNVFPLTEAVNPKTPPEKTPTFYWFSQTIGPGRGLEEFIATAINLDRPLKIDLRGHISAPYKTSLAKQLEGTKIRLGLLAPDIPSRMVACANGYSAGLCLELANTVNHNLCLANKTFTYLLAGTPVILTPTQAQSRLAEDLGKAALLLDLTNPSQAAEKLDAWLTNPQLQHKARKTAHQLGCEKYHWEHEAPRLLRAIESLQPRAQAPSRTL